MKVNTKHSTLFFKSEFLIVGLLWVVWEIEAANINFGPNGCTLQDAIRSANNDNAVGNCASGSGYDVLIAPDVWEITLNGRLPTISTDMTIRTATNSGLLSISGDNDHAVMQITGQSTDVLLERVIIKEGNTTSTKGAGIQIIDASVVLRDSYIAFNSSRARFGAGIYIDEGELDIENSFLEYNSIRNTEANSAKGGALYAKNSVVTIVGSRFVGNDAKSRLENIDGELKYWDIDFGASVFMEGGNLSISDSLFSEDDSAVHGEAVVAEITNSTFNRSQVINWHDQRGHVFFAETSALTLNHVTIKAALRVENTILQMSNSILQGDCNIGASTSWIVDAGNLYNTPGFMCPDTGNLFYYPKLLTLANNGGITETFALQYTSDAINAGDQNYCLPTDQRGNQRDSSCDIGAYEAAEYADIEVTGELLDNAPYVHGQELIYQVTVRNNSPTLVNQIQIDLDTNHAFVADINNFLCPAFPCILNGIQGNQTITIPVQVTLSNFDSDFEFDLTAVTTAQSTFTDIDTDNNQHILNENMVDGADLAISMDLLTQGGHFIDQVIEYEVDVENLGFNTATGISFDFVPTGLSLVSFSGCASVSGNTCQLANLLNGNSANVTVLAKITAAVFDATAEVESAVLDIYLDNNIDIQGNNGALGETDINVDVITEFNPPYYSYGYMQFKVKIGTGNQSASNVRVWESYPGAEFIGCSHAWNINGYCEVSFIPANSSVFVTFDYFNPIIDSGSQQAYSFYVFASPGETDLNPQDNEFNLNVDITATSDLAAQLELVNPPPYFSGQELEFHLRVVNGGLNHADDVLIDIEKENLSLVWMSGNLCQSESCEISEMQRFNEENMVLVYSVVDEGDFSLSASVVANQADQNPGNNSEVVSGVAELAENDVIFEDGFE